MNKRLVLGLSLAFLAIALLGTCSSWPRSDISSEQLHVINTQLDTLHEQIAAVDSGGIWLLLIFGGGILIPVVLALILLARADRIVLHNDEILSAMDEHGLTSELIDTSRLLRRKRQAEPVQKLFFRIRRFPRAVRLKPGKRGPDDAAPDRPSL